MTVFGLLGLGFNGLAAALALTGILALAGVDVGLAAALALALVVGLAFVLGRGATALAFAFIVAGAGIGVGLATALALAGIQSLAGMLVGRSGSGVSIAVSSVHGSLGNGARENASDGGGEKGIGKLHESTPGGFPWMVIQVQVPEWRRVPDLRGGLLGVCMKIR